MFFKKKKKEEKLPLKLFCIDNDPILYVASFLALCRQINFVIERVDSNDSSEYSALISSIDSLPLLQDGDFSTCRNLSVITYLNYVGSKPKIIPRKARILARQNFYSSLISNILYKDREKSEKDKVLSMIDQELQINDYIADIADVKNEITLADIYLFGYIMTTSDDISTYKNIADWSKKIFSLILSKNNNSQLDEKINKQIMEKKV
jgi:hypothetical protein